MERDVLGLLFFDILGRTGDTFSSFSSCDGWGRRSANTGFSVDRFLGLGLLSHHLSVGREWRGGVRRPWVGGERLVEPRARLAPDGHGSCKALHYGRARRAGVLRLKDSRNLVGTLGRIREFESRE